MIRRLVAAALVGEALRRVLTRKPASRKAKAARRHPKRRKARARR